MSSALDLDVPVARSCPHSRIKQSTSTTLSARQNPSSDTTLPKLAIFALDGCLWRPEMYELLHFSSGKGAPFTVSEHDENVLLTVAGQPVKLLKNVRDVMRELHLAPPWKDTKVGISSRTDAPHWARELLSKFTVKHDKGIFVLEDVFDWPSELSADSKVKHFQRIAKASNVAYEDMIFFDNEYINCESVADMGVTVGYCPGGVSTQIWEAALAAFPAGRGNVIQL